MIPAVAGGDNKSMGEGMKKHTRNFFLFCLGAAFLAGNIQSVGASTEDTKNEEELQEIVVGCDEYEPYNYFDKNGNLAGIDADLAEEAFHRMGYETTYVLLKWTEKEEYLENGVIDCIWDAYSMNGEEDKYLWSEPYIYSEDVAVVNEDSPIQTLDDLDGKRIATLSNTRTESILQQGQIFPQIRPEMIYSFQYTTECLAALRQGYVDVVTGDKLYIERYMQNHPGKLRILDESLETSRIAVAFAKDADPELVEQLNKTIEAMRQDGTIDEILTKYEAAQTISAEGEDSEE